MPLDVRRECANGLSRLIKSGTFPEYIDTGRFELSFGRQLPNSFRERELTVLHYADLRGALYQNVQQWQRVQMFVHSFTVSGRGMTKLVMPHAFGEVPARFEAVKTSLPSAFRAAGLEMIGSDPGGRYWLCQITGGARMESLPEPYGKWFQHRLGKPRWGQSIKLQLDIECVLSFISEHSVSLDFTVSAFAPSVVYEVGRALAKRTSLARGLHPHQDYMRTVAHFHIKSERISLANLR